MKTNFKKKNKGHYRKKKKSENVLYLNLSALVARARHPNMNLPNLVSADCKRL